MVSLEVVFLCLFEGVSACCSSAYTQCPVVSLVVALVGRHLAGGGPPPFASPAFNGGLGRTATHILLLRVLHVVDPTAPCTPALPLPPLRSPHPQDLNAPEAGDEEQSLAAFNAVVGVFKVVRAGCGWAGGRSGVHQQDGTARHASGGACSTCGTAGQIAANACRCVHTRTHAVCELHVLCCASQPPTLPLSALSCLQAAAGDLGALSDAHSAWSEAGPQRRWLLPMTGLLLLLQPPAASAPGGSVPRCRRWTSPWSS